MPVRGHAEIVVRDGRQGEVTSNTSATIGGVATATVMPATTRVTPRIRAALVIHEAFHVFQGARHAAWSANEVDFFTYPHASVDGLAARRREYALLRRALLARDRGASACDAFVALTERRSRFAALGPASARYEQLSELNEGLATYVQRAAAGTSDGHAVPDSSVIAENVRMQAYRNGAAFGRLLDRFAVGWRDTLERRDSLTLDGLLLQALGRTNTERPRCGLDAPTRAAIDSGAARDVAALRGTLDREAGAFFAKSGWRLVIDASRVALRAKGFDPLNVRLVSEGRVLHAQYLSLAGATGAIETRGTAVMTDAAGAHPLFSGVRLLTITGLASAPVLRDSSGTTVIAAPGVTGHFVRVTVERDGQSVRLLLLP